MPGAEVGAGVAPPGGGGGGPAEALWLAEALARRASELRAPLAPPPPRAPGAGAPPAPPSPTDVVALAEATREGLSRVKARCLNLAEALEGLESRAAPLAAREGRARAGIGTAAAGLQAAAIAREEAHAAELAQVRERRAQLLRNAGGAGSGPAAAARPAASGVAPGLPRGGGGGADGGCLPGEGQVVQAAEELRRALAGRGAGGGARGLADVRLEFKLDRNFNVKEVWEAEDSGEG